MKLNNKNKILVFSFIILLLVVYQFAIKQTIHFKNEHSELKNKERFLENTEINKNELIIKNKKIDLFLQQFNFDNSSNSNLQSYLLRFIGKKTNDLDLQIISFEEAKSSTDDKTTTTHYNFSVEGSFNKALLLANTIDNNPILGNIIHFETIKKTDYKENKVKIISKIILEKKTRF
ncbi:MAG: hypothetical protein ACJAYP_000224 [Flavobacterium sp.]|jgi:hypothetical protein